MGLISKPIFSRLAKRFEIRQDSVEQLESGKVLVPVTNVDDLLRKPRAQQQQTTSTAASHTYTVPAGKVWYVHILDITRANAGTNQFTATIEGYSLSLDAVSSSAAITTLRLPVPLKLGQGDSVNIQGNAGTSGLISTTVVYTEEDA